MKKALLFLLSLVISVGVFFCVPTDAKAITVSEVQTKLNSLISEYPAGDYNPTKECYYFVQMLTNEIFGHNLPKQQPSESTYKYSFTDSYKENYIQVGETLTVKDGTLNENSLKNLFSLAQPGDVIQMDYTHNGDDSLHVMMVYSASSDGVVLYHAGAYKLRDGKYSYGKIYLGASTGDDKLYGYSKTPLSYSDFMDYFCSFDDGISLYRSKKIVGTSPTHTTHIYTNSYDAICNICEEIRSLPTEGYQFNTVEGGTASTYSNDVNVTVSIFGRDGCINSQTIINSIINSGVSLQKNVRVLFIDCDKKTKEQVKQMAAEYKNSNIIFCYDTSDKANTAMWDFAGRAKFGNSITFPLIAFTRSDGTVFKITNGVIESDYLYQLANCDTSGEEIIDLSVSGVENYDYSYEVLNKLNNLRKSLNLQALTLDGDLMTAAMQRAAELSIYYSHTRPNGESCFTILNEDSGSHAENIAIGQKSPDIVMSSWTNSSGHYKNMTNKNYSSVGIGCFKTSDGYLCWVQLFSTVKSSGATKSGTIVADHVIEAQRRILSLSFSPEQDIHKLKNGNYTKINVWNCNKGFPYSKQVIDSSLFNYSSANNKVIAIDTRGYCTIKGNGITTVTVTHKKSDSFWLVTDYTVGHTYSNNCDTTCNYCGAKRTIKHTYTNNCDTSCNVCKATRTITHAYKTTTTKATLTKNGSIVKKCTVCGNVASNTTIKYAKTFKLSTTSYTYNGKAKTPGVTVKNSAGKTLKKNTDYTVTYATSRKNVGTYKVTIKMKGNYTGTKTLTFKINPVKTTVSKLTAGKKSIKVTIGKKAKQVTGYEIQYAANKKFKSAKTKIIKNYKTNTLTLKKLTAKKTYYVRVRTYKTVGKTKYYSGWSTYKYVKTK